MTSFVAPMSYQEIQQALNKLQKDHEKLVESNKRLEKAFYTGKINNFIFEGLYEGGQVMVVTLTGKNIPINVRYSDKVEDVQQRIYEQEGIPIFNQRLIFGGKCLKPHRSLYNYKIPIGGTLHLVMNMHPPLRPWVPKDPKEIADDQYYIDEAVRKLIEKRQFEKKYGNRMEILW